MPLSFLSRIARFSALVAFALHPARAEHGPPPGYYDKTFGLTGVALETMLHEIVREHTVQPYTFANQGDTWDAIKVLDRDPADATRVIEVFSGASVPADDTSGGGNPDVTLDSWEREHLWPRSYGVGNTRGAVFSDLFNLRPINPAVNQTRGNRIFDDPDPNHPTDPAVPAPGAPECRYDAAGDQGRLWAPRPAEKAELARAMFYMHTRYDGRDQNTVNLRLTDDPDTGLARFGRLSTLLDWHAEAAVSEAERRRNDLIFTEYQGNRNPFVDVPGFADRVFAGAAPPTGLNVMLCRPVLALDDGPAALTGVVALSETATTDTVVTLQGDAVVPGLIVPESVTVNSGQSTAFFTIDAMATSPPSHHVLRDSWTLTASAAGFGSADTGLTLLGAGGRGWETFNRLLIYGNAYRDGGFIGENGIRWNYFHASSQRDFPIDGRGILLTSLGDESRIQSDPIPGGIDRLSINLRKAFTGTGARQVEVLVNGVSRGFSQEFGSASGADSTVHTFALEDINVAGDFTLEIRSATGTTSSRRQLVVDDIRWTGWPGGSLPEPALAAFPDRLTLPGYIEDWGPGEEVRFRVFGTRLGAGPLVAQAPAGFEIARDEGPFDAMLDLPEPVAGMTAVFLRARMTEALPQGPYAGNLVLTGGGAPPLEIPLEGVVTESASQSMPGLFASGYQQDFSDFATASELPFGWTVVADGSAMNLHDISPWGNSTTGIKRGSEQDPVLGYQHTQNTGNAVMRLLMENRTGQTLNALDIQYLGRVERDSLVRFPEFTTRVNGAIRPALAFSTEEADGTLKRDRFGGLHIPPGGVVEVTWTSDRGEGSGSSRQIGLSGLVVALPAPPVVSLNGPEQIVVEQGAAFADPGAVAEDEFDGPLPVDVTGVVDTAGPGVFVLGYGATNSLGLEAEPVARGVTVLGPFDFFARVTHGLQGEDAEPTANPTGDGLANLLKFALGGDPLAADPSIAPELVLLEDNRPALRFRNGPELFWNETGSKLTGNGLEIALHYSSDLTGWNPAPAELIAPPDSNPLPAGTEILLGPRDAPGPDPLFLRLKVVLTED